MFQFVTRAVRVIDLITNIDMTAFQAHCGLQKFVDRLEVSYRSAPVVRAVVEVRPVVTHDSPAWYAKILTETMHA